MNTLTNYLDGIGHFDDFQNDVPISLEEFLLDTLDEAAQNIGMATTEELDAYKEALTNAVKLHLADLDTLI